MCLLAVGLAFLSTSQAQLSMRDSTITHFTLELRYQGLAPQNQMQDRYGYSSLVGIEGGVKFYNQWMLSTGLYGFFTDAVRETDMLNDLITDSGFLVTDDGQLVGVNIQGRGIAVPLKVGRMFSGPFAPNPNCGFYVEVGGQYLRHRIKTRPAGARVAGITNQYTKGYDRLSAGFGVVETLGYRYLSNRGGVNFSLGITASQNFTQGRRSIQFDTGQPYLSARRDDWVGFFASWIFPVYNKAPESVYYR